jgi:hypothetical protein|tara:strand:- start:198 stop:389 length:192 start_codon:yes stop_codon:yes gene_type:complete
LYYGGGDLLQYFGVLMLFGQHQFPLVWLVLTLEVKLAGEIVMRAPLWSWGLPSVAFFFGRTFY